MFQEKKEETLNKMKEAKKRRQKKLWKEQNRKTEM
jgi:hypothetical protein